MPRIIVMSTASFGNSAFPVMYDDPKRMSCSVSVILLTSPSRTARQNSLNLVESRRTSSATMRSSASMTSPLGIETE